MLHCAQHITLQPGRLSLPQCSGLAPVTWQCLGKRCICKAEVQGGCWNAWLCSCCEVGELRLMVCFAELSAGRIGLFFSIYYIPVLLLLNHSVLYFAITSACCVIFQCPRTCFLFRMRALFVSSGLLTFSLFNCDWDQGFTCHFPYLPHCRSQSNC